MEVPQVDFSVNLLLFPLVGGYYIATRSERYKYLNQRLGSQAVLFNSIIIGIPLLLVCLVISVLMSYYFREWVTNIKTNWFPIQDQYFGTCALSFIVAILVTKIINIITAKSDAIESAIRHVGNELELLFSFSALESEPIQITLKNDKVYIGWVEILPQPSQCPYVRVIPLFSGYRDVNKELKITTDYSRVYNEYLTRGMIKDVADLDVNVVIQVSEILTAGRFEFEIFEKFEKLAKQPQPQSMPSPPIIP